jgi:hypothetical protein
MNFLKKLTMCGLAAGAIGLLGGLSGCSIGARVYDTGGPYSDSYLYAPGYSEPSYPVRYYNEPGIGVYFYDRDGHRHYRYDRDRRGGYRNDYRRR